MTANVRVELFDPADAAKGDLLAYHLVTSASRDLDVPGGPPESLDELVERLRNPFPGLGDAMHWFVRVGGEVIGHVYSRFPEEENGHMALVQVVVRPDLRRRGFGTAALRAVLPVVRARGRQVVEGWNVVEGSAGEQWARTIGFQPVRAVAVQELPFAEVDRGRWITGAPEGYRFERWIGVAPEGVVRAYAHARNAIHDAPTGATEFSAPEWTVEKVRVAEAEMADQGVEQRVVAAVREPDGAVAGLTEVVLPGHRSDECYQGDTAVLGEHRGLGLGMRLKAAMAEWLISELPALKRIETMTSADNTHMLRVNDRFGFTTLRVEFVLAQDVAALEVMLGSGSEPSCGRSC